MTRVITHMAVAAAFALLAAMGCGKDEGEPGTTLPPPMNAPEVERGVQACAAYVERVCACARARPDDAELADQCHMNKSAALDMVLEVNRSSGSADERIKTERTAQRIVASCIEEQSKLDSRGCPRPAGQ